MITHLTILLVGVSGVGKTTACKQFVARQPNFVHMSASQILADATGLNSEQLRKSSEYDIVLRQRKIESFILRFKSSHPDKSLIIDGHSIIDNGTNYVDVPFSTIRGVSPNLIIHLSQDSGTLFARRCADNRSRPLRTPDELCQYQKLSEQRALYFAELLKIPGHIVHEINDVEILETHSFGKAV